MSNQQEQIDTITINDVVYVRKDSVQPVEIDGNRVMVRSKEAGVFAGVLDSQDGSTIVLKDARRIWYWAGAATLSELATRGTSRPNDCKFPAAVPEITILGVCEIIPMTVEAVRSILSVKPWSQ